MQAPTEGLFSTVGMSHSSWIIKTILKDSPRHRTPAYYTSEQQLTGLCKSIILLSHKAGRSQKLPLYLTGHSAGDCGSSLSSGKDVSYIPSDSAKHLVTKVICESISFPHCWQEWSSSKRVYFDEVGVYVYVFLWRKLLVDVLGLQDNWNCLFNS